MDQMKYIRMSQGQINFITQLLTTVSVNGMQVNLGELNQTLTDLNTEVAEPKIQTGALARDKDLK